MQQRTRRLVMLLGGTLLATVGFLAACSSDNGGTPLPGSSGSDSGRDTKKDPSDTTNDDDNDDDDDTSNDGGTAPDCSQVPKLRSNDGPGFFCAFFTRDASAGDAGAGGDRNCTHDETCCNPGKGSDGKFPASFCAATPRDTKGGDNGQTACAAQAAANGSAWAEKGGSTWECNDKNNCDDNQVCCMFTWANAGPNDKVNLGPLQDDEVPKACNALQAFKQGGTRCATSCASDEIQLCSLSDDSCTGNQKCTPFSGQFRDLGACRQ